MNPEKPLTASRLTAVCHDRRNVISGTIHDLREDGCELRSGQASAYPVFPQKARVLLHLLNEENGRSVLIPARLVKARRLEGAWEYRVRWNGCPALP